MDQEERHMSSVPRPLIQQCFVLGYKYNDTKTPWKSLVQNSTNICKRFEFQMYPTHFVEQKTIGLISIISI